MVDKKSTLGRKQGQEEWRKQKERKDMYKENDKMDDVTDRKERKRKREREEERPVNVIFEKERSLFDLYVEI